MEGLTTPPYSLGTKLFIAVCRSTSSAMTPTCIYASPTGSINLGIFTVGNLLLSYISNLPPGVTNEGLEAKFLSRCWGSKSIPVNYSAYIKQFLAPLSGTPVYKIGELHTIFYLLFLVLLVYLPVLPLCPLSKVPKNQLPCLLLWVPLKIPSCVTSLVTTTMTLSALLLLHLPLQHLHMKLNLLY